MFEIINETNGEVEVLKDIKQLLENVIVKENLQNCMFNIIIVDNDYIHKLNRDYRGIDRPTDVISFALEDNKDFIDYEFRILGDIYISKDKALEQSILYGHSFLREMSFLTVHGLLHLLGYDHMEKEEEEIMFKKQEEILNEYGITK